ncbi:hypothetical protein MPL3365_210036 [Mesorhizobium plurifarium]|uniref:Uncharacterized protein n=1 Tax=Mesorhizobium plurifarium TaxID=69974 RepID=A0A090G3U4_MESPL|nr:hypothetical protein MPL3365_210036 [Mesorhizobium plurifarium]
MPWTGRRPHQPYPFLKRWMRVSSHRLSHLPGRAFFTTGYACVEFDFSQIRSIARRGFSRLRTHGSPDRDG